MSPLATLLDAGAVRVDETTVDDFVNQSGPSLLLFTGDPRLRPEADDVAVIARELARQEPGIHLGVVAFEAEERLKPRFKVSVVPTVVFLEGGRVLSTVMRLQPWATYRSAARLAFDHHEVPHD